MKEEGLLGGGGGVLGRFEGILADCMGAVLKLKEVCRVTLNFTLNPKP